MKKIILITTTLLLGIFVNAQIVNIPDANFKNALITHYPVIDTNGDGEIQVSEASAYTDGIFVAYNSISDLTGIEYFTSLTVLNCIENSLDTLDVSNNTALVSLNCSLNNLSNLDVSNNTAITELRYDGNNLNSLDISNLTALTILYCSSNQITSLDVSSNIALETLSCGGNLFTSLDISNNTVLKVLVFQLSQVTSIDVSNNIVLTHLWCDNNQLTSLNLENNIALEDLICRNNQLNSLDVSNNTSLNYLACGWNQLTTLNVKNGNNNHFLFFGATNNPNLYCIEVDAPNIATSNWTNIDPQSYYSDDCPASAPDELQTPQLSIFPNPTTGVISITNDELQITGVEVFDIYGKEVYVNRSLSQSNCEIDLSTQPKGIYIIKVQTSSGIHVEKIVLE